MENDKDINKKPWLDWAVELQALAQAGIYYTKDKFDLERFERIREIAAEMVAHKSDIPIGKVKDIFCAETGYQTPKLDTRGAVIKDGRILLVQESDGKWALPGGWCDVNLSVKENTIKEVREEAGLYVTADRLIAVQDRDKNNPTTYTEKICKIFILCTELGGEFKPNTETLDSGYFSLDDLPELAVWKTTKKQLEMCFAAYADSTLPVVFD